MTGSGTGTLTLATAQVGKLVATAGPTTMIVGGAYVQGAAAAITTPKNLLTQFTAAAQNFTPAAAGFDTGRLEGAGGTVSLLGALTAEQILCDPAATFNGNGKAVIVNLGTSPNTGISGGGAFTVGAGGNVTITVGDLTVTTFNKSAVSPDLTFNGTAQNWQTASDVGAVLINGGATVTQAANSTLTATTLTIGDPAAGGTGSLKFASNLGHPVIVTTTLAVGSATNAGTLDASAGALCNLQIGNLAIAGSYTMNAANGSFVAASAPNLTTTFSGTAGPELFTPRVGTDMGQIVAGNTSATGVQLHTDLTCDSLVINAGATFDARTTATNVTCAGTADFSAAGAIYLQDNASPPTKTLTLDSLVTPQTFKPGTNTITENLLAQAQAAGVALTVQVTGALTVNGRTTIDSTNHPTVLQLGGSTTFGGGTVASAPGLGNGVTGSGTLDGGVTAAPGAAPTQNNIAGGGNVPAGDVGLRLHDRDDGDVERERSEPDLGFDRPGRRQLDRHAQVVAAPVGQTHNLYRAMVGSTKFLLVGTAPAGQATATDNTLTGTTAPAGFLTTFLGGFTATQVQNFGSTSGILQRRRRPEVERWGRFQDRRIDGNGNVTLAGNVTMTPAVATSFTVNGGGTLSFNSDQATVNGNVVVGLATAGTLAGPGTLDVSGNCDYEANTTVNPVSLVTNFDGAAAQTFTDKKGATSIGALAENNAAGVTLAGGALTAETLTFTSGTLSLAGFGATFNGLVTGSGTLDATTTASVVVKGGYTATGYTKNGAGQLIFAGTGQWSGASDYGTVLIGNSAPASPVMTVTLASGVTVSDNGLTIQGDTTANDATLALATFDVTVGSALSPTGNVSITAFGRTTVGGGGLVMAGTGAQTLSDTNTSGTEQDLGVLTIDSATGTDVELLTSVTVDSVSLTSPTVSNTLDVNGATLTSTASSRRRARAGRSSRRSPSPAAERLTPGPVSRSEPTEPTRAPTPRSPPSRVADRGAARASRRSARAPSRGRRWPSAPPSRATR